MSPSAPPADGAQAPGDFARALADAQGTSLPLDGELEAPAVSAPTQGASREARAGARLAGWLALMPATQPTAVGPLQSILETARSGSARVSESLEPGVEGVISSEHTEQHPDAEAPSMTVVPMPAAAPVTLRVWSVSEPSPDREVDPSLVTPAAERHSEVAAQPPAQPPAAAPHAPNVDGVEMAVERADATVATIGQAARGTPAAPERQEDPNRQFDVPGPDRQPDAPSIPLHQPPATTRGLSSLADIATSDLPPNGSTPSRTSAVTAPGSTNRVNGRGDTPLSSPARLTALSFAPLGTRPPVFVPATGEQVAEDHAQSARAPVPKRKPDGPTPPIGSWGAAPTHAFAASVASVPVVGAPPAAVSDTASGEDLRSQIVQAMRVQWHGTQGDARIRLRPEYLGELSISLRVEQGAVTAQLSASSPEVRQWIEANEALLRQGLAQHDLKLERLVITTEEPSPAPQHEQEHEREQRDHRQSKRRARRSASDATFEVVV